MQNLSSLPSILYTGLMSHVYTLPPFTNTNYFALSQICADTIALLSIKVIKSEIHPVLNSPNDNVG